jgi:hypothetical protein
MKRLKPDQSLQQIIDDISETKPATRTLVSGAYEFINEYNQHLLLKLLHRLLRRLMPHHAVDVWGVFLGNMSIDAQQRLEAFYGDGFGELFGASAMKQLKAWATIHGAKIT